MRLKGEKTEFGFEHVIGSICGTPVGNDSRFWKSIFSIDNVTMFAFFIISYCSFHLCFLPGDLPLPT